MIWVSASWLVIWVCLGFHLGRHFATNSGDIESRVFLDLGRGRVAAVIERSEKHLPTIQTKIPMYKQHPQRWHPNPSLSLTKRFAPISPTRYQYYHTDTSVSPPSFIYLITSPSALHSSRRPSIFPTTFSSQPQWPVPLHLPTPPG